MRLGVAGVIRGIFTDQPNFARAQFGELGWIRRGGSCLCHWPGLARCFRIIL